MLIGADGAVSGRRAASAAVITMNGRLLAEGSRALLGLQGCSLVPEVAGVALADRLADVVLERK